MPLAGTLIIIIFIQGFVARSKYFMTMKRVRNVKTFEVCFFAK